TALSVAHATIVGAETAIRPSPLRACLRSTPWLAPRPRLTELSFLNIGYPFWTVHGRGVRTIAVAAAGAARSPSVRRGALFSAMTDTRPPFRRQLPTLRARNFQLRTTVHYDRHIVTAHADRRAGGSWWLAGDAPRVV